MSDITVMLACNNERGDWSGEAHAFEFTEDNGAFLGTGGDPEEPLTCAFGGQFLIVNGASFPFKNRQRWVGNMAWDSVDMTLADARRLLAHLLESGQEVEAWTESSELADLAESARGEP